MKKIEKAYKNIDFLNSPPARPIRILSEFIEPLERFKKYQIKDAIVFFGSARILDPEQSETKQREKKQISQYYSDARELAYRLTKWSNEKWPKKNRFPIMTGGGPGIMRAANEGASKVKGSVNIGLNISLPYEQNTNPFITPDLNFEFHYFFARKFWFINMARVLVVFPGGFGTLDELFELLTLVQTGKISKRVCICLYGNDYWQNVINFDYLVKNELIDKDDLKLFNHVDTVEEAFELISTILI